MLNLHYNPKSLKNRNTFSLNFMITYFSQSIPLTYIYLLRINIHCLTDTHNKSVCMFHMHM